MKLEQPITWTTVESGFTAGDGARQFDRAWQPVSAPADHPRRALVFLHRGHEHSGRIAAPVERFGLQQDWAFAYDARGHGYSPGERGDAPDFATLASDPGLGPALVRTNVVGLAQAFDTAAMLMQRQGYGQLVAVASIAGLLKKYPGGSLYSASKRAALHMCDAYRMAMAPFGIAVTAIVPGYVDTARLRDLNGGDASAKPFLQPEAVAIKRMAAAIEQRAECLIFPWQLHLMARLFNCLPRPLRQLRRK